MERVKAMSNSCWISGPALLYTPLGIEKQVFASRVPLPGDSKVNRSLLFISTRATSNKLET